MFPDYLLSFNYMYPYFVKLLNELAIQPLSTELCSWKWAIFMPLKITFYCFFNEKGCIYCLWLGCLCVDLWKIGNPQKLNLDVSVFQTCAVLWSPVWITKVSCSWAETAGIISPSVARHTRDVKGPRKVKGRKGKNISLFVF